MRRLGYIVAALLLAIVGVVHADQGWQDNQVGQNYTCTDVGYFQANNLIGTGTRCIETDSTGKIIPMSVPCGTVIGVTATAPLVCTPSSPAPNCSLTYGNGLSNVSGTLSNDLHTGVSGGQSAVGGTGASDYLCLQATNNGSPTSGANIYLQTPFGNDYFDTINHTWALGNGATPISLFKAADQKIYKSGGALDVGTTDGHAVNLQTNGATGLSIDPAGNVSVPVMSGSGVQCVQVNNAGVFSGTGSACGGGGGTVTSVTGSNGVACSPSSPSPNCTLATFACSAGQFANGASSGSGLTCGTPTDTGITQLTHDVLAGPGSGSQSANVVGIEDDAICRGDLLFANESAPSTPSSGDTRVWTDATAKTLFAKNEAGTVTHMAKTQTNTTGQALTALADDGSWTRQAFQAPLTCGTDYLSLTCVSGATDLGGTNITPTVTAVESGGLLRGKVVATEIATPALPSAGTLACWADSGAENWDCLSSSGVKNHGAQTHSNVAGQALTALGGDGSWTTQTFQAPLTACTDYVSVSCQGGTSDIGTGGSNSAVQIKALHDGSGTRYDYQTFTAGQPLIATAGNHVTTNAIKNFARTSSLQYAWGDVLLSPAGISCSLLTTYGDPSLHQLCQPDGAFAEYNKGFAANYCRITVNVPVNTWASGGVGQRDLTFQVSRNGSVVTGCVTPAVTAGFTGVKDSGEISVAGTAASDVWGVFGDGAFPNGGTGTVYVNLEIYQ